jgi:hypothetical protein
MIPLELTGDGLLPDEVYQPPSPSPLPKILAAGGAVVAGVMAAHLKITADQRYDEYQRTGDPALLAESNVHDTEAAMALLATQACLALLAYLLLRE